MIIFYRDTTEATLGAAICGYSYGWRDWLEFKCVGDRAVCEMDFSMVQSMDVLSFIGCFPTDESVQPYMERLSSITIYYVGVIPPSPVGHPPELLHFASGVWVSAEDRMYLPLVCWLFFMPNRPIPPALRAYFGGHAMAIQAREHYGLDRIPDPSEKDHWLEVFRS